MGSYKVWFLLIQIWRFKVLQQAQYQGSRSQDVSIELFIPNFSIPVVTHLEDSIVFHLKDMDTPRRLVARTKASH